MICGCCPAASRSSRSRCRLRWIHDVFGNSVAIATFDERAETLSFSSHRDGRAQSGRGVRADRGRSRLFLSVRSTTTRNFPTSCSSSRRNMAIPMASCRRGRGNFSTRDGPTPTFNISERHDPWHPRGVHLSQAPRAGHPASARHAADRLRHLPRLCAVHDRGAAPARHRRALRVRLSVHSRRPRARLCRRRLDPCLGAGLSAERRLDRVRSDQRHRRHPRSRSASRWRATRVRRSRCTAPISVRPTRSPAWRSASTSSRSARSSTNAWRRRSESWRSRSASRLPMRRCSRRRW